MRREDDKRALHRAVVTRILNGDAATSPESRRAAFDNAVTDGRTARDADQQGRHVCHQRDGRGCCCGEGGWPVRGSDIRARVLRGDRSSDPSVRPRPCRSPKPPAGWIAAMRLDVVDHGHGVGAKLLFRLIRVITRRPLPDAIKFILYHPGFQGGPMRRLLRVAMHGPSAWSLADRELMAAYVSKVNECAFCAGAHSAVAARAYRDKEMVAAVLAGLESAPIPEPLEGDAAYCSASSRVSKRSMPMTCGRAGDRCLERAGRGRAGGLLPVQHGLPVRRCVRLHRAG